MLRRPLESTAAVFTESLDKGSSTTRGVAVGSSRPSGLRRSRVARLQAHRVGNFERDGVPRSVAMAMVGHQTQEVYTRYAIVDQAMIREAALKMNRGAKARRSLARTKRGVGPPVNTVNTYVGGPP
jgi:hypothetical protein